jgi:hypothetical protein
VFEVSLRSKRGLLKSLVAEAASRLGCPKILEPLMFRKQFGSTALPGGLGDNSRSAADPSTALPWITSILITIP